MASTVTSTPNDVTISSGFWSTSGSGTISWTAPTIPDGATIKSCVLTGTATASGSNVKSIKINDKSITVSTSGYNFTIDFGKDNSKTSVDASITKSGSSWSSCNVKFTNMTYTVTYDLNLVTYTVTFKNEDGSVIKTERNVSSGTRVSSIQPTVSKTGYTLLGWYDEQGNDVTHVTSDVVLTARFQKNPILTVTQNAGGYALCNNTRYEGNFTLEVPPSSSIELTANANDGYYIKSMRIPDVGELIKSDDKKTTYPFSYNNIQTNESLIIEYASTAANFTVTFKDWDGTVLKTQTVASGGAASAPDNPTRDGYTFSGWDKDYNHVTSDLVVTAQYTKNVIVTVTQNAGGYIVYNNTRYEGDFTLKVAYGGDVDFEVHANDGYYIRIAEFVVDGFETEVNETNKDYVYTTRGYTNIRSDETFLAEYARVDGTEEPPTTPSTTHILIGNNRVNKIYIGNTSISKVYLGNTRLL